MSAKPIKELTTILILDKIEAEMLLKELRPLHALAKVLKEFGFETMPFYRADKHLYIRCDNVPFSLLELYVNFGRNYQIDAKIEGKFKMVQKVKFDEFTHHYAVAYLHLNERSK